VKKKEETGKILVHFPGVKAEGKLPGYEGWFNAQSVQFGVGCGVGSPRPRRRKKPTSDDTDGGLASSLSDSAAEPEKKKRNISEPSVSEIVAVISDDVATPILLHAITNRNLFPEVTIVNLNHHGRLEVQFVMKDVAISGFSLSVGRRGEGGSAISVSFNFEELAYRSASELRRPIDLPNWANKAETNAPEPIADPHHHHWKISDLNDELLEHVFGYLETKQLFHAGLSCKRWARISSSHSFEKIIVHETSYNLTTKKVLLDGVEVPSTYVADPDEDDY